LRLELPAKVEPSPDFIEALVARYEPQIEELKQQVQLPSEKVQSLTEQLQKPNSRNSSLPPSSDHPYGKPPREPSKRRIRKQVGHDGPKRHLRELVPIEQCEAVISCVPESCQQLRERTAARSVFSKRTAHLRVDSSCVLISILVLKEILLISRFACPKTAQIWAERIAKGERSNAPVSQLCQSIGCAPTSSTQWKRTLAAKSQTSAFRRAQALRAHQGLHRDQNPRSRREA